MELLVIAVVVLLLAAIAATAGLFDRPRRSARRTVVVEAPVRTVQEPVRTVVTERQVVTDRDGLL